MNTNRRQFLKACGLLGLGAAVNGVLPVVSEAARIGKEYSVHQTRLMMGTIVTITALHPSKQLGEEAVGRAFEEIKRLEAVFSRFDASTPVSVLNKDGKVSGIPAELAEVMDRSRRFGNLTDNTFDVTVQPVVDLFRAKQNLNGALDLSKEEFEHALSLVGQQNLKLSGRSIRLDREGMGITLDGIAKGYIVDKASAVLAAHGAVNHMINAGGDIRTMGEKDKATPWTIAIEDPAKNGNYPTVISMNTGAIATSGGYEVFYDKKHMYSHLVSPVSGKSPNNVASVSVTAPTVMEADALATAVSIMQTRKGLQFINSLPGREALIIARTGEQFATPRWA